MKVCDRRQPRHQFVHFSSSIAYLIFPGRYVALGLRAECSECVHRRHRDEDTGTKARGAQPRNAAGSSHRPDTARRDVFRASGLSRGDVVIEHSPLTLLLKTVSSYCNSKPAFWLSEGVLRHGLGSSHACYCACYLLSATTCVRETCNLFLTVT